MLSAMLTYNLKRYRNLFCIVPNVYSNVCVCVCVCVGCAWWEGRIGVWYTERKWQDNYIIQDRRFTGNYSYLYISKAKQILDLNQPKHLTYKKEEAKYWNGLVEKDLKLKGHPNPPVFDNLKCWSWWPHCIALLFRVYALVYYE